MPIRDRLQEKAENYIVEVLTALALGALSTTIWLAEKVLPPELLESLGMTLLAKILLAMLLIIILLSAWLYILRPRYIFIPDIGVFKDKKTGVYHCVKCDKTPLKTLDEDSGWWCTKCSAMYDNPPYVRKLRLQQEVEAQAEDARIRRANAGLRY